MRRPSLIFLAVSLIGMALPGRCPALEENTRKDFERLAGQFQFFCGVDFLFDRPPMECVPADVLPGYLKLLSEVTAPKHETAALLALLKHRNPRVRTLAIAALYAKEDPKVLPQLVDMVSDAAITFPAPQQFSQSDFERDKLPPLEECQVGGLASAIVESYMESAGFFDGIKPGTEPGFGEYWAARKDRAFCASWFEVQLHRASQCTFPIPEGRVIRIRAVRERIDKLPKVDRAWTLLWLHCGNGDDYGLTSEEDLLAACKDLGPERLLAMLRRKVPSDDPDLQSRPFNNANYKGMQGYVLGRAEKVLRPEDAPALLDCERDERDYENHGIGDPLLSVGWVAGAASLQPEHAKEWLHDAMKRFNGQYDADNRGGIATALWRLVGPEETAVVVNWFYEEQPQLSYPDCRSFFLRAAAKEHGRAGRKLIATILRDKRFETLDWQSLETLVEIVNAWVDQPVVDKGALRRASHPLGMGRFDREQEKAQKEYPKETEELLKTLAGWRAALRDSIPKWDK